MTRSEISLIRSKADFFEKWAVEESKLARQCFNRVEADEHFVEAIKFSSSASALRNILIELGY